MEQLKNELGALVYSSGECNKIQVGRLKECSEEKGKERKKQTRNLVQQDDESFSLGC